MSLIITNKELKNVAIIILSNKSKDITYENIGDFTLIKSQEELVGINIRNYSKYLKADQGVKTFNQEQYSAVSKHVGDFNCVDSYFVVGEVISAQEHKNSAKLLVLKINIGKEIQIVTNDLSVKANERVVVAKNGATLPSGLPIKEGKVMGVLSEGMLCGGETLGKEKTNGVLRVKEEPGTKYIL